MYSSAGQVRTARMVAARARRGTTGSSNRAPPLAIILLLAVGADYNLLLVSRFKEEMHAGLNTAIIRSMGG
ncbi:MAG: MMPL family transporter, partial [Burkholderiales bacterium]|nr:MMPL family transporter [Burkholderiales bacterium]